MKTSVSQFELMVEFMEGHGDLSKPSDGPQGRLANLNLWSELTQALNADGTGDPRTTDKWRRVWSDLKNNTKRKAARIHQATTGTGGGPACKSTLSTIEDRVIGIMGPQAALGMAEVVEVGLEDINTSLEPEPGAIAAVVEQEANIEIPANWSQPRSQPSTSSPTGQWSVAPETPVQPSERPALLTTPPPPPPPPRSAHASPRRRRLVARRRISGSPRPSRPATTQAELTRQQFVRSDTEWRAFQQEKERHRHEVELERLRLREVQLQQEARWQALLAEFLSIMSGVAKKYIEKND